MDPVAQRIEIERIGRSVSVISLYGEHDLSNADDLRARFDDLIEEECGIVVNVSESEFIDSTVLNQLLRARKELEARDRRLVLQLGTQDVVRRVFEVSGVLDVIPHGESRDDSIALVTASSA